MADQAKQRRAKRTTRRRRVRRGVLGIDEKPRLSVFRSLRYTYAQLISDRSGRVLAATSTKQLEGEHGMGSVDAAQSLGKKMAELAKAQGIEQVVFDRNGYVYHGRVAAVAEGAREAGLQL